MSVRTDIFCYVRSNRHQVPDFQKSHNSKFRDIIIVENRKETRVGLINRLVT